MGALVRLLLGLIGIEVPLTPHLTFVSKTLDMLPLSDRWKPYVGGALHLLPPMLVAAWLLAFRRGEMTYTGPEVATLLLAVSWCFVGPALIWSYERRTIPSLMRDVEGRISAPNTVSEIRSMLQRNVLKSRTAKAIMTVWVASVSLGFVGSVEFVKRFGVRGYEDPLFWVIFGGILYLAVYSSIGIAFAWRAIKWTRFIASRQDKCDIYSSDGVMGFAYLGRFALNTNMMYLSGWLMIPVLYKVIAPSLGLYAQLWVLIVIGYTSVCLILFWLPVMILHNRILQLKCDVIDRYGRLSSDALAKLSRKHNAGLAERFEHYRGVLADARSVGNWPLGIDEFVKFGLTVLVFPLLVSLFAVR